MKHIIKTAALEWLANLTREQVASGRRAEDVEIPVDLPTLRDASVLWGLKAFEYLDARPELVKQVRSNLFIPNHTFTFKIR